MQRKALMLMAFLCSTLSVIGQTWNFGGGTSVYHEEFGINFNYIKRDINGEDVDRNKLKDVLTVEYEEAPRYFAFLERRSRRLSQIWEASYTEAKISDYEFDKLCPGKWRPKMEDLKVYSMKYYMGIVIPGNKRIQLPIHAGAGFDYLSGGPMSHLTLAASGKARLVFYLTRFFGVFGGVNANANFGQGKTNMQEKKEDVWDPFYDVKFRFSSWNAEAGITIML